MNIPDATLYNHGSICVLTPHTDAAREWIAEHIPDDAMMWGSGIVIEPRYVDNIVMGMQDDGLTVA